VRWPDWLIPKVFQDLPGDSPKQFKLTEDICFTVRICWEGVFADFLRRSVREGGHFLVQMNNANWFGRTAAEPQHNLSSIYRAVENRIPVAVASNTGPSLIIDPYGHILSKISDFFVPGTATADVPLGNGLTFYTKFGDVFAFASMAFVLLGWIVPLLDKRKKKRR
jgi:apolipoprotein N-acyltransferase